MKKIILILISLILTSCATRVKVIDDKSPVSKGTATLLLTTLPTQPTPPEYADNFLPKYKNFKYDLETWNLQFKAVKDKIAELEL